MYFGNMITNISLGLFYFAVAGMAMPVIPRESPRKQVLRSSRE
jgi:hypothetical protein